MILNSNINSPVKPPRALSSYHKQRLNTNLRQRYYKEDLIQDKPTGPSRKIHSRQKDLKFNLNLSIVSKEVYVIQDGCSAHRGNTPSGFSYPIPTTSTFRIDHIYEMQSFFLVCNSFFKPLHTFRFVYSYKGKLLRCLHEISSKTKLILVSPISKFQGVKQDYISNLGILNRSPCFYSLPTEQDIQPESPTLTKFINDQFSFQTHKLNKNSLVIPDRPKSSHRQPTRNSSRAPAPNELKQKLGDISNTIDRTFPSILDQGLTHLKSKYKFAEGELHKLWAKFKLLVMLSCGIDPSHNIRDGINRETFIEYHSNNKDLNCIIGKIFDCFDKDGGGTVDWKEYLNAMHVMRYGTYGERIELFFRVYDSDGSGSLDFHEICELFKVQLQGNGKDQLIEELSMSFAAMIFDITGVSHEGVISAEQLKKVVEQQKDKRLIDIFCNFSFVN